jgi:hypothetical protein
MPERVAEAYERYPEAWMEVWNEPDQEQFWGETPDPEAYVRMFAACRAAAPGARLIGPGVGGGAMDWAFLERAARAGPGRHLTAVSIHPYGVGHPDQLQPAVARLRALFGAPVVISEWGFDEGPTQADLVQAAVRAAARAGVEFLVLYSWADSEGPRQGLTNADGSPRAALQRLMGRQPMTRAVLLLCAALVAPATAWAADGRAAKADVPPPSLPPLNFSGSVWLGVMPVEGESIEFRFASGANLATHANAFSAEGVVISHNYFRLSQDQALWLAEGLITWAESPHSDTVYRVCPARPWASPPRAPRRTLPLSPSWSCRS